MLLDFFDCAASCLRPWPNCQGTEVKSKSRYLTLQYWIEENPDPQRKLLRQLWCHFGTKFSSKEFSSTIGPGPTSPGPKRWTPTPWFFDVETWKFVCRLLKTLQDNSKRWSTPSSCTPPPWSTWWPSFLWFYEIEISSLLLMLPGGGKYTALELTYPKFMYSPTMLYMMDILSVFVADKGLWFLPERKRTLCSFANMSVAGFSII